MGPKVTLWKFEKKVMSNTYTQIYIQCVFAVKFRKALIQPFWKDYLLKYITGIVQNHNHKLLSINSMPDHLHMFFGFQPNQSLSDLMNLVKGESSEWINKKKFTESKFRWQTGYGAFSYSRSQIKSVCTYIEKQEERHRIKTFLEEYTDLLKKFEVEYDEKYIFQPLV